ncbi:MAG: bifunctional fucokinase/fucose-1-phosphate guanylyltransferase [Tannerellaceae bacterium]
MKKLLSLPPNLVNCFHDIEHIDAHEWFCTSDPVGERLGSGGGTTWLLEACRQKETPDTSFDAFLSAEKRILLHAGGQSRRLPGYAPSGKILTPIPVFRWARGQQLGQHLLSLQLPLYEEIMRKAPDSLHTLIASGDVLIRTSESLQPIPEADVVCYGLWVDPVLATNHGVFVSDRKRPAELAFMLQKPSLTELGTLAQSCFFLMDIGIWLLSDRAVSLLAKRSMEADGKTLRMYDLYSDFGLALGSHPRTEDAELNALTVAILPLPGGEFYHFGTSRELISSTLAIQNCVTDQRAIMHRKVKPHPAMFIQNAAIATRLTADNSDLWIENSAVGMGWKLDCRHVITGVPDNDWTIHLPAGVCIDVVPFGADHWVARPYGFMDPFKGEVSADSTCWMGAPLLEWFAVRGLPLPKEQTDIQNYALFPSCSTVDELGVVMRWMVSEPELAEGKQIWQSAARYSANELSDQANLLRLVEQRETFRRMNWSLLAANHEKSVFYQLDLSNAADSFAAGSLPLPEPLGEDMPLIKRMNNHMFRARVMKLSGRSFKEEEQCAFALLREGVKGAVAAQGQRPFMNVYADQIVWGRSPVRIDLAGGWTDTPPYCLYAGGQVVNAAIELNGQPPLQVYVKPSKEFAITLRSIDLGAMERIHSWEELRCYNKVGSPFSIPKAALALAGFIPEYAAETYGSLEAQLQHFGCGLEVTLLAAIPAGSGLGTSSILAATVLGALSDFCGLAWDKNEVGNRTLLLEQLLTTGGGWQDQFGGILHGLKLLQTNAGLGQSPLVRWLPEHLFSNPDYRPCHLLYYTGITRTAKDILADIVRGMFLNSGSHLRLLAEMKGHTMEMYEAILRGDFPAYGALVGKTWEQNKELDAGTNPAAVEQLIVSIRDFALGYKLPGAGGGGYLYMVAKDPEAALRIRRQLADHPLNANARFVEMSLSDKGLQVSRS